MEKVKKAKKENRHGADFGLRILSIIIAVIIWFALSITQYPTINKTITNVPVVFSLDGTQAKEKGLQDLRLVPHHTRRCSHSVFSAKVKNFTPHWTMGGFFS